jgi:DnaK suppressor protein
MAKKIVKKQSGKTATRGAAAKKAKVAPKKSSAAVRTKTLAKRGPAGKEEAKSASVPKTYSPDELKYFKELIMEKRKETVEELDTLKESIMDVTTGEYVSESSNYSLHMEQGTDAMEREKTFLFASRGSKFVTQLDDALTRIDAKTYGVCKVCGLLVPKERLEAVPTAQTCAEYKNTGVPCERGRAALARIKQGS